MGFYKSKVLQYAPTGYYRLDDASGNPADSSGNGNNATGTAGSVNYAQPGCINSEANNAISFTSAGAINLPTTFNMNGSSAFSFVLWVNPTTAQPANGSFYSFLNGPNSNGAHTGWIVYQTGTAGTGSITFQVNNGTVNKLATYITNLVPGQRYMIAGTYDGANIKLYLNKLLVFTTAQTGSCSNAGTPTLGVNSASFIPATTDELALWNATALTLGQIEDMFATGVRSVYDADTFFRGNQSGWGTASGGSTWAKLSGTTPTFAIAGNEGTWTVANTSSATYALGTNTLVDSDQLVRIKASATNDSLSLFARSDATAANFYRVTVQNTSITLSKTVAGSSTNFNNTTITFSANTFYWLRFRVVGTNLYAKWWADGTAEPDAWTVSTTDSTFSAAGRFGLRVSLGTSGDTVTVDSYTVFNVFSNVEQTQQKFYTQFKGLISTTRSNFLTRISLIGQTRAKFFTLSSLITTTRARFIAPIGFITHTRAHYQTKVRVSTGAALKWVTGLVMKGQAWANFLNDRVIGLIPFTLKPTVAGMVNMTFTSAPFVTLTSQEIPMAQPNSTIQVTVIASNINNLVLTNLATISCVITFPDGSVSPVYSLANNAIVNSGQGKYVLVYQTKTPGLNNELWTATDNVGNTSQMINKTPVSF